MSGNRLRAYLIATLVAAAVAGVVGNKTDSRFIHWLSLAFFLCALAIYAAWRRAAIRERRDRVFDREAKTHETGTRSDK